jgi:hypothetical protein
MRAVLATSLLTLMAVVAAGCGGDGGSDSEGAPDTLSKAEYIERADAICQQLYEQRSPLEVEAARAAQKGDTEAAAVNFQNAADITENRVREIKELPAPEGDEATVEQVFDQAAATVVIARRAATAISEQDGKALARESRLGLRATTRFNKSAISYGFLVCGRGASAEIGT